MKKLIAFAVLVAAAGAAIAACPPLQPYGCTLLPSGKQLCGCGR